MPESSSRRRPRRSRPASASGQPRTPRPARSSGRPRRSTTTAGSPPASKGTVARSAASRPRSQRAGKRLRRWALIAAATVVAVLVIGAFVVQAFPGARNRGQQGSGELVGRQVPLMPLLFQPSNHIEVGGAYNNYSTTPPTSGPHWAANWALCGIYDEELPDAQITHNMEHGQVIISYNMKDPEQVNQLKDVARGLRARGSWLIVRPYPKIKEGELALTAWGFIDQFKGVDKVRIEKFYDAHFGRRGPEKIPCSGSRGG